MKAWLRLGLLLAALLLAGCSSINLAYNESPRLAAWWIDRYLDLDRAQSRQLDVALRELLAWHRRHELPALITWLQHADAALDGGVSEAELNSLEEELTASVERTLLRAAPLARPLLASLRPAQWQHLQARQARRLAEWREEQAEPGARAREFEKGLERWLGGLEPALRRRAHIDASQWAVPLDGLVQARTERQADAVQALRAWADGDVARGMALLMRGSSRDPNHRHPAEVALRQAVTATLVRLLADPGAAQLARTRAQWAEWRGDLQRLHSQAAP